MFYSKKNNLLAALSLSILTSLTFTACSDSSGPGGAGPASLNPGTGSVSSVGGGVGSGGSGGSSFVPTPSGVTGTGSSVGDGSGAQANPVAYVNSPAHLSAAWANDGGDKIAKAETRASRNPASVANSLWKNNKIVLFGAKNEVVDFNLVLEALNSTASGVTVSFDHLDGPGHSRIGSATATGDGVYDWTKRDIELFYIRYLQINGLSRLGYEQYDERHIPKRLERPFTGAGAGSGTWNDRPDHNQYYPDIAVPLESVKTFEVVQGSNQSVWADIYIPRDVRAGVYQGAVTVTEGSNPSYTIPVELTVRNFALPETPSSKTMLNLGYGDIAQRYVGENYPSNQAGIDKVQTIRDRHFMLAHRHKISLIDNNSGIPNGPDQPTKEWLPRLNGNLFSSVNGYRGPGEGVGNGIFSIGTYGSWGWQKDGQAGMNAHSDAWTNWFAQNANNTEFFLYLIDESSNYGQIQTWANELNNNQGPGHALASMATMPLTSAVVNTPSLKVVTSTMDLGDSAKWDSAYAQLRQDPSKRFYMYNGKRPASGSFMTDDDGVALRELSWGQYKKGIDRWFYWESTYYKDFQGGRGDIDVMNDAQTFGGAAHDDAILGKSAGNYANGDGLLFYPGTDTVFPNSSYGLNGPIASLRLKQWRRGIQDVDYLTLAASINPSKVQAIVNSMVGKVLWENGVSDANDPTWVKCDIGWSTNPDTWEAARAQLADIIEGK